MEIAGKEFFGTDSNMARVEINREIDDCLVKIELKLGYKLKEGIYDCYNK